MTTTAPATEIRLPDGRVTLADDATLDSRYSNGDLAPLPAARRTWSTYNYAALWIGMSHNIPSYLLASGLIALGMNWVQAVLTIALANLIVLIPMLLNSHAGTKYGIPYPVFARASFGLRGANLAAVLRALIACGWFGIQTWIGGEAVFTLIGAIVGHSWAGAAHFGGYPWTQWLSFAIFWVLEMAIILRGMNTLRRFENWAAPFVLIVAVVLLVYLAVKAHGFGSILSQPSKLGWGSGFWPVFFPSLMGMIAFWSTLSLNMPDFTRFSRSQRGQALGQALGLPTTMTFFSLLAVFITAASQKIYGAPIWDPIQLSGKFHSPVVIGFALFTVVVATLAVNVAANTVSPSYDFSNLAPRFISFRTGSIITGIIGIVIQPWRLLTSPGVYIYTWLGFYGGLLGAVAGVLIADYWLRRRTELRLAELYQPGGRYWYQAGWNWQALVAFLAGAVLAVGGAWSAPHTGPFPLAGLIPVLQPLYSYSWVIGLGVALVLYTLLSGLPGGRLAPAPALTGGN
ncbi:MAG: NCS1 family nucleobase:cation symporter-1 [Actinobacteria bacterium]|nr:NCS1 family nucleobase:cation symporter-1 [Actinomycetota bacterium]